MILNTAAERLWGLRIRQWPRSFPETAVEADLRAGNTWILMEDGRPAGTMTVRWADPLWPGDTSAAGYVHRLAVRRPRRGHGRVLLERAADLTLSHGRALLRLDCAAENTALRTYYERTGFVHRRDVAVALSPGFQLLGSPSRLSISLFEMALR
ncbi:GNAT family N-acetyltransferase [Actinoplanes auranticolor]|nr:GNAT family N-acetyltransferase [Actinoplanes auranticolor]